MKSGNRYENVSMTSNQNDLLSEVRYTTTTTAGDRNYSGCSNSSNYNISLLSNRSCVVEQSFVDVIDWLRKKVSSTEASKSKTYTLPPPSSSAVSSNSISSDTIKLYIAISLQKKKQVEQEQFLQQQKQQSEQQQQLSLQLQQKQQQQQQQQQQFLQQLQTTRSSSTASSTIQKQEQYLQSTADSEKCSSRTMTTTGTAVSHRLQQMMVLTPAFLENSSNEDKNEFDDNLRTIQQECSGLQVMCSNTQQGLQQQSQQQQQIESQVVQRSRFNFSGGDVKPILIGFKKKRRALSMVNTDMVGSQPHSTTTTYLELSQRRKQLNSSLTPASLHLNKRIFQAQQEQQLIESHQLGWRSKLE